MDTYIKITFSSLKKGQSDILIAQLTELGFEGFEEEISILHAFIRNDHFIRQDLLSLVSEEEIGFSEQIILPANWNQQWEKDFQPVRIGDFCLIRAIFHAPVPEVQFDLIITPKMSFGTGHHPTTLLMIEAMRTLSFVGKEVLDFGTGTGLLAILAEKMGAGHVVAIDNDDWSIENSKENFAANHCTYIDIYKANHPDGKGIFDVILANLTKDVILPALPSFEQHLAAGGVLLLSGLLQADLHNTELACLHHGFQVNEVTQMQGWICIQLRKNATRSSKQ